MIERFTPDRSNLPRGGPPRFRAAQHSKACTPAYRGSTCTHTRPVAGTPSGEVWVTVAM